MDERLIAWARAVKRRNRVRGPVLWLFTDPARGRDPLIAAARLPQGLCGVVFRHDGVPGRAALGLALARICRARRLGFVVAGDTKLAIRLRAGLHLRAGRWPDSRAAGLRRRVMLTSSAHSVADLLRARRAGVAVMFLSPVFATLSHPGATGLGAGRFAAWGRGAGVVYALGGISGRSARALPRGCGGAGAIGALGG